MSYGLDDAMFGDFKKVENYKLKNGEHKFRILPPYAPGQLYHFTRLHWYSNQDGSFKIPVKCAAPKKAGAEELCPICAVATKLKNDGINLKAQNEFEKGKDLEDRASLISARATYIWQLLDNEGQHKVLSVGYRAHEALKQKIGFFWKQKQINVVDPERNYKIYCNRTGQKAQTNYAFEVLDGPQDIRKIDMPELEDLSKLHQDRTFEELKKIADDGFVTIIKKGESAPQPTPSAETPKVEAEQPSPESAAPPVNNAPTPTEAPPTNEAGMGSFTTDDIPF